LFQMSAWLCRVLSSMSSSPLVLISVHTCRTHLTAVAASGNQPFDERRSCHHPACIVKQLKQSPPPPMHLHSPSSTDPQQLPAVPTNSSSPPLPLQFTNSSCNHVMLPHTPPA
jgi:hypothetical protein